MASELKKSRVLFVYVFLFFLTASPVFSSPLALVLGFFFVLLFGNPAPQLTAKAGKLLLKISVVGLGFGVDIGEVLSLGRNSLLLTLVFIVSIAALGYLIGSLIGLSGNTKMLISFGTAICGGSAIAALAPVLKAKNEEIAVSLATVFSLNALALLLFPWFGKLLSMSQEQFGLWCALAIHDTSSVVGAASTFGAVALTIGTTAKLTRALWIAPCVLMASVWKGSGRRISLPYFIFGFIAAAVINSWLIDLGPMWDSLYVVARQLLVMTLFLVGAGLTKDILQQVGLRPLLLGLFLWAVVSVSSLLVVMN
jgi:uncharacterized integral membrane protein (TIGR00698 family)